LNKKLIYN